MALTYLVLFLNIVLLVSGQMLWKIAVDKDAGFSLIQLAQSPYIWSGLFLYGVATLLWFYVLDRLPLSVAYPMQSLAYALGVIAALFVFQEQIPPTRWLGLFLIFLGVLLVARSSS